MFSVQFGSRKLRGGRAQFQPGLRRLYGPASAILPLYWRIGARYDFTLHEYVVDCASVNRLSPLTLNFNNGVSVQVLPRDYTVQVNKQYLIFYNQCLDRQPVRSCFWHARPSNSTNRLANW